MLTCLEDKTVLSRDTEPVQSRRFEHHCECLFVRALGTVEQEAEKEKPEI